MCYHSFLRGATAILCATSLGCATIITGRTQSVTINSLPSGATATVDGQKVITPGKVMLRRDDNYIVKVEKDGHAAGQANINSGLNPWLLGNVLIGGIIGLAIDFASGSAWKLSPDQVNAELTPLSASPPGPTSLLLVPVRPGRFVVFDSHARSFGTATTRDGKRYTFLGNADELLGTVELRG